MIDLPPTRRADEPPTQDGAPLAGWPVTLTADEAAAIQTALKQLHVVLDAVTRERDEARAEVERLREALAWYGTRVRKLSGADPFSACSALMNDQGERARKALEGAP